MHSKNARSSLRSYRETLYLSYRVLAIPSQTKPTQREWKSERLMSRSLTMAQAVVTVLLSSASAALVAEEHGSLSPMLQVIVPDGAAADPVTLATMARLVNVAMVSKPRVSMILRGFPTGEASELGWEGLVEECDGYLPKGGEHVKVAMGNNPSDPESLFAGWLELTEAQAQEQPTTLSGFVQQVRTQPADAMPYSLFGLPVCARYLAKVGLDVFDAVFGTAPGYFRAHPPNLYMHPSGGLLADTYATGRPYCTWSTRASLLRAVRTGGAEQLALGRALLYVLRTRTRLGHAVRTAYRAPQVASLPHTSTRACLTSGSSW